MSQHTPTPFYIESDGRGPYICAHGHGRVATIECQSFKANGGPEDWANAHFIADACNSFDELYGVLNAVRVATKFGKPVAELLPRIEEVLTKCERN